MSKWKMFVATAAAGLALLVASPAQADRYDDLGWNEEGGYGMIVQWHEVTGGFTFFWYDAHGNWGVLGQ